MSSPVFRHAKASDAEILFNLEKDGYGTDQSMTLEEIKRWIDAKSHWFLVLEQDGTAIGFIHYGFVEEDYVSESGFIKQFTEFEFASYVLIRSFVIEPGSRGLHYSSWMMEELERRMDSLSKKAIHIRCRNDRVDLARQMAFTYVAAMRSDDNGTWHQMSLRLSEYYAR